MKVGSGRAGGLTLVVVVAVASAACTRERPAPTWAADAGTDALKLDSSAKPPAPSLAGSARTGEHAPEPRAMDATCAAICEHSRACPRAEACKPNCLAMASATPCPTEFGAFYACLSKQPAANWECAEDGVAAIREGYCDKEQQLVVSCMNTKVPH